MTSPVETKIISMLDALQHGVVNVGDKAVKYAPDIADAALRVTQISGVAELLPCVFIGGLSFVLWKATRFFWGRVMDLNEPNEVAPYATGAIASMLALLASSIFLFSRLSDAWNYVAIISPKLYIAHQIIEKVLK